MAKNFKEWLNEGETLYSEAMKEFEAIQNQLEELEARLAAKQDEVNEIAKVIGKPPVDVRRKGTVQVIEAGAPGSVPSSRNTIAKALTGRLG